MDMIENHSCETIKGLKQKSRFKMHTPYDH